MAEDTDKETTPPTVEETEGPEKFSVEYLLANSYNLTGHSRHVLVGALHGTQRKNLTAAEAKKLADNWLSKAAN